MLSQVKSTEINNQNDAMDVDPLFGPNISYRLSPILKDVPQHSVEAGEVPGKSQSPCITLSDGDRQNCSEMNSFSN
jgi:hypothetical protein